MVNEKTVTISELKTKIKAHNGSGYSKMNKKELLKYYKSLLKEEMENFENKSNETPLEYGTTQLIQDVRDRAHFEPINSSKVKMNHLTKDSVNEVIDKFLEVYTSKRGFYGYLNEAIILSPNKIGDLGTNIINKKVQNALYGNSNKLSISYFGKKFYEGDRVIQTKNNAALGVFNGNIGFIRNIIEHDNTVTIMAMFSGVEIQFAETDLENLELAYAITVHKSQGGEWHDVFLLVAPEHERLLSNQIIYTAVSRIAKGVITLYIDFNAFDKALHKSVLDYITYADVQNSTDVITMDEFKINEDYDNSDLDDLPF